MNQKDIDQIVEFGFSREQAIEALSQSNGDINSAIDFLFRDTDPVAESYGDSSNGDAKGVTSAPIESGVIDDIIKQQHSTSEEQYSAPPLPPRSHASVHVEDIRDNDSDVNDDDVSVFEDLEHSSLPHEEVEGRVPYNVYDDVRAYTRKADEVPVIMPTSNGYYESYLAALLMILHAVPGIKRAVFRHEFKDLGYSPRWFKGEVVELPAEITEVEVDGEKHDLRFLAEVQRIFTFLDDSANRSFTSLAGLIKALPKSALGQFGYVDNLSDAYEILYKALSEQLTWAGVANAQSLFANTLLRNGELYTFGMFHIEAEDLSRTLYKSLNELIWNDSVESSDCINSLADTIMITVDPCTDDMFVPPGLELFEELYPQIYTNDFKNTVLSIEKKHEELEKERASINSELLKLKTHKGMHIQSVLDHSLEFLQDESGNGEYQDLKIADVLDDVRQLSLTVQERKESLAERSSQLIDERRAMSITNVDTIIEKYMEDDKHEKPEPYLLTGVILRGNIYCCATKTEDGVLQWRYVEHTPCDSPDTRFETDETQFDDIKQVVYSKTRNVWNDPLVLVFVKRSAIFDSTPIQLPNSSLEFLKLDNDELDKSIEWNSDTDYMDSSSDEGGDDDEPQPQEDKQQNDQPLIDLTDK
ncbi:Rup1p CYBJADRAFT_28744 [Cyberlindnera jadinii NRRL Y-1542]|uniref:UBA domain-containing protein n=1 Tax=Cyberlindnera jadinii (strain ATCC 18201 / CBS 1600 / BCRC 20928 / JCM 3617 / NBRC 0987 / NRRL Y-1542) TaxID=983966 RepID=A0A1E4RXC0_CYBJN|nr:hypothetical protein CYBJADRAFT_28744 [Cyberlindnera jadinii NRRL Y-1542]ODV71841.1 hypothetical protein CYBJADRAFT_28744 [Cyberlindnera jadinii NRRL Y-1542]